MAEATVPKGKGGLGKKVGPFPMKVWIAIAAGVLVLLYLHYRSKGQQGTSAGSSSQPTADTNTSGLNSPGDGTGANATPPAAFDPSALTDAVNNLTATLPYYGNYGYGTQPPDGTNGVSGGNVGPAPRAYPSTPSTTHTGIPASAASFAQRAKEQTRRGAAAFGGVVSIKKLKGGATLTTYASGRQVEQAPGKSAYVVHK